MAKKIYVGASGKARQVRRVFVGLEGKARAVRKGYVGIGGKARPFLGGGEVIYYGTIEPLTKATSGNAAFTVGEYAVFGEGISYGTYATAYHKTLTRYTLQNLKAERSYGMGAATEKIGLFPGGTQTFGSEKFASVEGYNDALTKIDAPDLTQALWLLGVAATERYVVVAGGNTADYKNANDAQAYDENLTKRNISYLAQKKYHHAAVSFAGYAVFAGGYNSELSIFYFDVEVYDDNLTKSNIAALNYSLQHKDGACTQNHMLIVTNSRRILEIYDKDLVKNVSDIALNSPLENQYASANMRNHVVFAGGGNTPTNSALCIDDELTQSVLPPISVARRNFAAAAVGSYALFAGGIIDNTTSTNQSVVDVYKED